MDLSVPSCLTSTPLSLVSFVGLDRPHLAWIWNEFVHRNRGMDRVPIRIVKGDALEWPRMKPKRNSYEWFIPKGILKQNWMLKHLFELPAVVVVWMELDWNEPNWNEKRLELASRVQTVRSTLAGRATKLAVVLVQEDAALPLLSDDAGGSTSISTERASALCSACELSARALFVLPSSTKPAATVPESVGGGENLGGYILRLENAFYELAQNYYHQEIRAVKAHRDYLNKTTHLYLFVRHQFKCGLLNELKRDLHAAYKHYGQAYSLLMEVRATDTNIMEVKTVAGFVSYKICKLAFRLNLPRDAISQFRKHMDIFQQKVGMDVLEFEHKGWQSKQCELFADIFSEAIRNGLPAIQTQHPGLYYQQAAQHAIARRELAEELCASESAPKAYPSGPDPLDSADKMEYYGQRPWRPGKVALEPTDMELEQAGIQALLHREKNNSEHSKEIIGLLEKSISQFRAFRSPRSESHLTVTMAEELKSAEKYREALELLQPVMEHYRREQWRPLLDAVLSLGLKCAYLLADAAQYVRLSLDLCSVESSCGEEEKARIMANVTRLFEAGGDPRAPGAEPGLTTKSERAAVGAASSAWVEMLKKSQSGDPVQVDMTERSSCIEFKTSFGAASFRADETARIDVHVRNGTNAPLPLSSLSLTTTSDYQGYDLEWAPGSGEEIIAAGKALKRTFEFRPNGSDVGKPIAVRQLRATIGRTGRFRAVVSMNFKRDEDLDARARQFFAPSLKQISLGGGDVTDGGDLFESLALTSTANIAQRNPLMTMSVEGKDPVLVGEWFSVEVSLDNLESSGAEDVTVSASLVDADDPLLADTTKITFDVAAAEEEATAAAAVLTPASEDRALLAVSATQRLGAVGAGSKRSVQLFVQTSTTGVRAIRIETSYTCLGCRSALEEVMNLESTEPFSLETTILSLRMRPMAQAHTDETFLLSPKLRSLTPHVLNTIDSWLELRHPVRLVSETPSQLSDCVLYKDSESRESYPLIVKASALVSSLDVQEFGLGKYVVKWAREGESRATTTTFELSPLKVCLSSLHATATMPAYGVVRTPLTLKYTLSNRTDKVQEYALTIETSESFMTSGNKQLHFKVLPERSHSLMYVLYPLLSGEAVPLPRMSLQGTRPTQTQDANEVLDRLLPKTITVLPREKKDPNASGATTTEATPLYTVGQTITVQNVAFAMTKGVVKA